MDRSQHRTMEVVLIRHGETEWSLSGQHTGSTDLPLTENGRHAARRLRPVLESVDFSLVLCSPMQRARDTCELAGLADRMQIEPDLSEWNYGDYEGRTTAAIHAKAPGWLLFRDGAPGGESPEGIAERVDRLIARLRRTEGRVALFAHGHVFRMLAARWIDLPPLAGSRFLLDTATLSILSHYRGIPAIRSWNAPLVWPS
jgi:broad specificity phosphatase PhoE